MATPDTGVDVVHRLHIGIFRILGELYIFIYPYFVRQQKILNLVVVLYVQLSA